MQVTCHDINPRRGGGELTQPAATQTTFPPISLPTVPLCPAGQREERGRRGRADPACHDSNQFPAHPLTHWATLCPASQKGGGGRGGGDELTRPTVTVS